MNEEDGGWIDSVDMISAEFLAFRINFVPLAELPEVGEYTDQDVVEGARYFCTLAQAKALREFFSMAVEKMERGEEFSLGKSIH